MRGRFGVTGSRGGRNNRLAGTDELVE